MSSTVTSFLRLELKSFVTLIQLQSKFELARCQETKGNLPSLGGGAEHPGWRPKEAFKHPSVCSLDSCLQHNLDSSKPKLELFSSLPCCRLQCCWSQAALTHPCLAFLRTGILTLPEVLCRMSLSCPGADFW